MSSEVADTCIPGAHLTTLVSTFTIVATLPSVLNIANDDLLSTSIYTTTAVRPVTYATCMPTSCAAGSSLATEVSNSPVVSTQPLTTTVNGILLASILTITKYKPVTYFICISAISFSTPFSIPSATSTISLVDTIPSANAVSCAARASLTTIVSTRTIASTLPSVINTVNEVFTVTFNDLNDGRLVTSVFVVTQSIWSTPTITEYRPVTYTTCIPTITTFITSETPTATPLGRSHEPQKSGHTTLIISTVVGCVVGFLAIALSCWMWLRRRRKLKLASRKQITETVDSKYNPRRDAHRKFSFETTVNGTEFTSPTLRDYVGSMPSVSERNLARANTDIQSAVYTDWSNIQRSMVGFQPHPMNSVNIQNSESERVSELPTQTQDSHTENHNPFYSPMSLSDVDPTPIASSYVSRGSSAFLRPADASIGARLGQVAEDDSQDQVLLPTVFYPGPSRQVQEQDDNKVVSTTSYSEPDSDNQFPRSPSHELVWAEALRRLERIHNAAPVNSPIGPTTSNQNRATLQESQINQSEAPTMTDDGDYETIMYQSETESRIQPLRGHGRDIADESVFSVDAVLRRIANQPPRTRDRW